MTMRREALMTLIAPTDQRLSTFSTQQDGNCVPKLE
jgi:hypothetical protein